MRDMAAAVDVMLGQARRERYRGRRRSIKGKPKYSDETKAKALAMRDRGDSVVKVCLAIGCSENTLRAWREKRDRGNG